MVKEIIKKKKWITILGPALFNSQVIGETYLAEAREGTGKIASVNLATLTGDPQKQTINVKFVLTGVEKDNLVSEMIGYEMVTSATRKMVRRGKDRLDDSFLCKTKDNKIVIVKTLFITKTKTKGSVRAALKKQSRIEILRAIARLDFNELLREVLMKKFQKGLHSALKKIYPLTICEIRHLGIVKPENLKKKILVAPAEKVSEKPAEKAKEEGMDEEKSAAKTENIQNSPEAAETSA